MSTYAETIHPAGEAAADLRPFGRVRDFLQAALPATRPRADDEVPAAPRSRHDALIHAARTALGGTVEW